jgi:hypothetical protein
MSDPTTCAERHPVEHEGTIMLHNRHCYGMLLRYIHQYLCVSAPEQETAP